MEFFQWEMVSIIAGIPLVVGILKLGFKLFNEELELKKALLIAIINFPIFLLARILAPFTGFHTLITHINLIILSVFLLKYDFYKSAIATLSAKIIIVPLESFIVVLFSIIFDISTSEEIIDTYFVIPMNILLILLIWVLYATIDYYKFYVMNINDLSLFREK
ncbi:hypothetical protein [Natranaerobius thermophilus]|uniref:hypothetical protein n=1 Tax=Natranaerobius thermophilus TaxID=375929 RepID=UPI0002EF2056|nr:hypothetical protein [Natranaerobius thermophilus]